MRDMPGNCVLCGLFLNQMTFGIGSLFVRENLVSKSSLIRRP